MRYAILTLMMLFVGVLAACVDRWGRQCGGEGQRLCYLGCDEGFSIERAEDGYLDCAACGHLEQRCCRGCLSGGIHETIDVCEEEDRCGSDLSCEEGVCRLRPGAPEPREPEPREPDPRAPEPTEPAPVAIDHSDCLGARVWEVVISDSAGCVEPYYVAGDSYEEASQCLAVPAGWHVASEGTRYRLVNLCQNCVGDLYLPVAVTTVTVEDAVMCATSSLGNRCTYTLGECPEDPPASPES